MRRSACRTAAAASSADSPSRSSWLPQNLDVAGDQASRADTGGRPPKRRAFSRPRRSWRSRRRRASSRLASGSWRRRSGSRCPTVVRRRRRHGGRGGCRASSTRSSSNCGGGGPVGALDHEPEVDLRECRPVLHHQPDSLGDPVFDPFEELGDFALTLAEDLEGRDHRWRRRSTGRRDPAAPIRRPSAGVRAGRRA